MKQFTAKARRTDPITSDMAADEMNESGQVSRQAIEVLKMVKLYGPAAAKELDKRMTFRSDYPWNGACHRRMYDLADAGYVTRIRQGRELMCTITKEGIKYLEFTGDVK